MNKPKFLKEEYLDFLNQLKKSNQINMFGAAIPLLNLFPELENRKNAREILIYWMETFK